MNEVRRFVRYSLPGIACITQLLIALSVSDGAALAKVFPDAETKEGIALVLAGLLASGGLGYFFSIVYFALIWLPGIQRVFTAGHRNVLTQLATKEIIAIKNAEDVNVPIKSVSRRAAWALITLYWHSHMEKTKIKNVTAYLDRLIDVMHANGATMVGTVFMLGGWAVIHLELFGAQWTTRCCGIATVWVLLLICMAINHIRVTRSVELLANGQLVDSIREEYEANQKTPVVIRYVR